MMQNILGKDTRNYWMGISIILIMLMHIVYDRGTTDSFYKIMRMMFIQGDVGVNIFFFLSAYGLCYSYNNNNLLVFYFHRFKRLYPMFLLILVIWTALQGNIWNFQHYFLQITGLSTFFPGSVTVWYIPALTILYITFPLLYRSILFLKNNRGGQYRIVLLIFLLAAAYHFVTPYINAMLWARMSVIVLGIATYLYQKDGIDGEKKVFSLYAITASYALFFFNDCMFYFYIPLLLYGLNTLDFNKLPCRRFFSFCGRHSLELYLGQCIGLQWFFLRMCGNFYVDALLCIGISICSAIILYYSQFYFWKIIDALCQRK